MRACVQCKWAKNANSNIYGLDPRNLPPLECLYEKAVTRDPVWGVALCQLERNSARGCGKNGKFWEKKD